MREARRIRARNRRSEFENLWHTLNLLELPPTERLVRSLVRGRTIIASKRATNRAKDRAILPVLEDSLRVIQSRRGTAPRDSKASETMRPVRCEAS